MILGWRSAHVNGRSGIARDRYPFAFLSAIEISRRVIPNRQRRRQVKLLISKAVRVLANHRTQHAMKTFRLYSCFCWRAIALGSALLTAHDWQHERVQAVLPPFDPRRVMFLGNFG